MADSRSWWDRLPEPIASIKGNALWSALSVAAGSILSGYFTSKALDKSYIVGAYITLAVVGAAFLIGGVISFLNATEEQGILGGMASVVASDCMYLLKTYKRLDYEDRQRVRLPLHSASWPNFGKQWDFYAVELYCAKDNFKLLKLKVQGLWQTAGRKDEPAIMRLQESSVMLDIIEALDSLYEAVQMFKR